MIADVIVILVLASGLVVLRGEGLRRPWHAVASSLAGFWAFARGLGSTRAGWVLLLFALSSALVTAARVSELGLDAFDSDVATGGQAEQAMCHEHQERVRQFGVASDDVETCPAGGGQYVITFDPTFSITCPRHGSSR